MNVELKYGSQTTTIAMPDKAQVQILRPGSRPPLEDVSRAVTAALARPVNQAASFAATLTHAAPKTVAIAIPDETRPAPVKQVLPALLKELYAAVPGLSPQDVTIVIGGGLHPPMGRDAADRLLPSELAPGCPVIAHDALRSPMTAFGTTSRGTSVKINAHVGEADFKITIGQIDPHQFVGFTGGSKGIAIGCAAAASIEHNHSLMFAEAAKVGKLKGNPVREDLNEAGDLIGIDWAVNVVLDAHKNTVHLAAGQPGAVLNRGAEVCRELYGVGIDTRFDIVVASCGGYPKDICLYQSQKGLNLASRAVKPGGQILLLAACPQGIGDDIYFDYVCQFAAPEEVLADFKAMKFKMGAHKAYLFGRTLVDYDVAISSELDPGILKQCLLRAAEPAKIVAEWVTRFSGRPKIAVVPDANTTYFYLSKRENDL